MHIKWRLPIYLTFGRCQDCRVYSTSFIFYDNGNLDIIYILISYTTNLKEYDLDPTCGCSH